MGIFFFFLNPKHREKQTHPSTPGARGGLARPDSALDWQGAGLGLRAPSRYVRPEPQSEGPVPSWGACGPGMEQGPAHRADQGPGRGRPDRGRGMWGGRGQRGAGGRGQGSLIRAGQVLRPPGSPARSHAPDSLQLIAGLFDFFPRESPGGTRAGSESPGSGPHSHPLWSLEPAPTLPPQGPGHRGAGARPG